MLHLAVRSAGRRLGACAGAFLALFIASALSMAWAMQLESILRTQAPVERYAGTAAVVAGHQKIGGGKGVYLTERARVSSALLVELQGLPGVQSAVGDLSIPGRLGDRAVVAHGWASAALTPYVLVEGRPPAGPDEVVTSYPVPIGARVRFVSTVPAHQATVVGVARPSTAVALETSVFLTDEEAQQLAGHPGQVDAIGVLAGPGFDASKLRAAAPRYLVLTGAARGAAEYPDLQRARTVVIPVTAAFAGLAMFIAMFVVAGTSGLSIQRREREMALLRAIAATPGQIRRMIASEATLVGLLGSAAGIWPGVVLGHRLAPGLVSHGIAPANFALRYDWVPAAAVITGGAVTALVAVLAAANRAARVSPVSALVEESASNRILGWGRLGGTMLALAGAIPLVSVAVLAGSPPTVAATSQLGAIFLTVAAACVGPGVVYGLSRLVGPPVRTVSPAGGFLASAGLRSAARRYASASTPLVLAVAVSSTLYFGATTVDHATLEQWKEGVAGDLAVTSSPGLPPSALADLRAIPDVESAVALTATTLGPSLGTTGRTIAAYVLAGDTGAGPDAGVVAGSLTALNGDTIALGRPLAQAAHARVGDRVPVTLGDGTPADATVVAVYTRELAFGEALLSTDLAAGHRTNSLLGTVLLQTDRPADVARELDVLAGRYPGLRFASAPLSPPANSGRAINRWLGPQFVAEIFAFASIAVVLTLVLTASGRRRDLALLRLVGGTSRQIASMALWEAALIVFVGVGLGCAIAAVALLPLGRAFGGGFPYVPAGPLAAFLGITAGLAFLGEALGTAAAMRAKPTEASGRV